MGTIILKNIKKSYGKTQVLDNINLEINEGEFVVLIGESGCGKSTLLRIICGLDSITDGELIINDKLSNDINPQDRNMAMVFQSYALYPHMNVFENIAFSLRVKKEAKNEVDRKVEEVAKMLNLQDYLKRFPKQLSGGQRQRVSMGRAIIRKPSFFLFDEPLSNLDAKLRVAMRAEIKALQHKLKTTTIYVTHDQIEAMTMADKVVLLDKGTAIQIGTPKQLYDNPNSIFSAIFLGSPNINLIEGVIKKIKNKLIFHTKDNIKLPIKDNLTVENNQEVILGIRPRDFNKGKKSDSILVEVNIVEYTGAEHIIFGKIGKNKINIAFSRKENFSKSEKLYITYDIKKVHVFDAKTHKVIN